ncbi:vasorin a [Clupea harengus]|uniref:Vasorin a n=1 Tax=Clupea harengus TaxID=7950 RepID=A0A6P3VRS3_CLUHA|nr:vasorin a [Clupea harengus]
MWFSTPAWPVLLLFLQSSLSLGSGCPESCSCVPGDSIFCMERRSSFMPSAIPASTKQLYVFQNGINTLSEDDFTDLGGLELLDLSQNQLVELPDGVFQQLSSLRNLDLSSNQITYISEQSFSGLVTLERLYLYSNRIQSIHPAAFVGLEKLLELKLQQNALTILPPIRLPRLLLLDISHNNIPPSSSADFQTPNLESLKMAGLGLTSLDKELMSSLTNLHDLDLSQNQLSAMPPALKSVKGLIRLSLASNQLGQLVKEDFENLVALQALDLSNLNLQGFPMGFFQLFPKLQQLTAAENPFNCLCPLAWFPAWLRGQKVELGRKEETRCHFPPSNSGKVLVELDHKDFGCPVTTTVRTQAPVISSTLAPLTPTSRTGTTTPAPPSVHTPSPEADSFLHPQDPAASPSSAGEGHEEVMCPSNICLNGGTCKFNQQGQVECLCPSDTTGLYCENLEESQSFPSSPEVAVVTAATPEPDISSRHVTSTSILLDLHRYIETRPHIRGIRLTYRNLSGPDQRPIHLSVPATYPEYTLRGLRPNCTYSVCASPLGEPGAGGSCMEARTAGAPITSTVQPRIEGPMASSLVLALAGLALVMVVTAIVAVIIFLRRRKWAKAHVELDAGEPTPLELEGVKTCLENGAPLPQKQPEITPCPPQTPNGVEYEVLLMQGQTNANNNVASLKPSYF